MEWVIVFIFLFLYSLKKTVKRKDDFVYAEDILDFNEAETENGDEEVLIPLSSHRPVSFKDYVGQEKIKEILSHYLQWSLKTSTPFPHTLISGKSGAGKTTLARIIAYTLKIPFVETIASSINSIEQFYSLLEKVKGGILFVDEIHALSRDMAESIYSLMEDNPTFTLIGATTELGEMMADRSPFVYRFKLLLNLQDYSQEDIITILKKYKKRQFPQVSLHSSTYKIIARNCKANPRLAIRLFEATVYFNGQTKKVLRNFGIIENGFTETDLKILEYLNSQKHTIGLQGLSSYLQISVANYLHEIEPYLLSQGLIIRTPKGRTISEKGKEVLKMLKKRLIK